MKEQQTLSPDEREIDYSLNRAIKMGFIPPEGKYNSHYRPSLRGLREFIRHLLRKFEFEPLPSTISKLYDDKGRFILITHMETKKLDLWTNKNNFTFKNINIPSDNFPFFEKNQKSLFISFSPNMKTFSVIYGKDIVEKSIKENRNSDHGGGQIILRTWYRVPIHYAKFFNVEKEDLKNFIKLVKELFYKKGDKI
jgi:hypothetical protein